jgi:hypothetical protein
VLPAQRRRVAPGGEATVEVIDLTVNGVRVTILPTASSRPERAPDPCESAHFLQLAGLVPDQSRPEVLLTYGGHPARLESMRRARLRGIAVVFHLGGTRRTL